MAPPKLTPLMKQYFAIKEEYSDAILLFQVGDFYELFFDDAIKASAFLAIALTKRGKHQGQDIPLCGVPIHALNHYLVKLVRGGFKVALCEQLSKPIPGKVVERAVTQVFTPGTLTDESMLDDKSASYLLSFFPSRKKIGLVFTELLTAQLFVTAIPISEFQLVEAELSRFCPDEIIIMRSKESTKYNKIFRQQGYVVSDVESNDASDKAGLWLEKQFTSSYVMQVRDNHEIMQSLHTLYCYLKKNHESALSQFRSIQVYKPDDYLILDAATQKNLEIIRNIHDGTRKSTLFSVLDKAATAMGSRMIKKWLQRPLVQKQAILQRQEVVAALSQQIDAMQVFKNLFGSLADLERIVGRIALKRATLHDYLALKNSLKIVPEIKQALQKYLLFYLTDIVQVKLRNFVPLVELLACALHDNSSSKQIIKKGFDQELDRLRGLVENSQKAILNLEQKEIEKTGITSLKIRYNNVAGYYIEVTKANIDKVPDAYVQQQTLVNRNRYMTQELKELERDILKAQNEIDIVEQNVFERVKLEVEGQLPLLRELAQALAYLDGLLGFALVAYDNNYIVPEFIHGRDIVITQGRHPIVEQSFAKPFIPNDTALTDLASTWIITGPNMGGKSTYLRQVALLSIMAQSGSLIPAEKATLPILDRIFTRIGSGDNLAQGKSTFLVEMEETAVICSQATENSLVILDEVGRGTSTFDGMALAQAIIEYIVEHIRARCLFATHYHELTHLKDHFSSIENYHMASKKADEGVLFLYKILKGVAAGSFGIEVAKLAQLPKGVITRAGEILKHLDRLEQEKDRKIFKDDGSSFKDPSDAHHKIVTLEAKLAEKNKLLEEFDAVSLNNLSPRQAFDLVWKLKEKQ